MLKQNNVTKKQVIRAFLSLLRRKHDNACQSTRNECFLALGTTTGKRVNSILYGGKEQYYEQRLLFSVFHIVRYENDKMHVSPIVLENERNYLKLF